MSVTPEDLLAQHARSTDETRKTTVRIPLDLLRDVWRFGVDSRARSEGESLVAVLRDWQSYRRRPARPSEIPAGTAERAARIGTSEREVRDRAKVADLARQHGFVVFDRNEIDRTEVANFARQHGFVVFDRNEIDLTEAGLGLEDELKKVLATACHSWIGELMRDLRAGRLPGRVGP